MNFDIFELTDDYFTNVCKTTLYSYMSLHELCLLSIRYAL